MSEDVSLKFGIEAESAVAGLAKIEASVKEIGGALKEQLAPAAAQATASFEKLGKAEGVRGLTRGIVDAENAMKAFKAAADQAAASGQKIPAGVGTALKTMQAEVDASTMKLGKMRDQMGDIKTRADAMGQSWQQAASSGGSLNAMLSNLEGGGNAVASAFAKTALATAGVVAAFKVGYEFGKTLSAGLKTLGVDIDVSGKAWSSFAVGLSRIAGDTKVGAWLRDLGDSTRDYSALLTPLPGKMNEVMKAQQALSKEIQESDKRLKDLNIEWHKAGTGAALLKSEVDAMAERIRLATKSGESFRDIAKDNTSTLDKLQKEIDEGKVSWSALDVSIREALVAHNQADTTAKSLTGTLISLGDANKAYTASLREQAAAMKEANAEFAASEQFIRNRSAAIKDGTETLDQYGNAVEKAKNTEGTWTAILMTVTEATDAQRESLHALLAEQNAYGESVAHTLSVAKGWEDYLVQITEAYKTGATSLLTYKRALEDFQTQLLQTFSGATGKAKAALEDMIATIQRLIATAGQGGPVSGDFSHTGALNRAFNP